ncbi:TetR/AcrR family transcriptional regulator [Nocardioides sp.]|uniref:TetR/AcrR family transcriptional regulator n=1 Tax=Nocardioides sp. TaxID=35761 RepID=UPI003511E35B
MTTTPSATERAASHRARLLDGLADAVRADRFAAVSVADVVRLARTSRRTFYEHFASLEECYVELMRRENRRIIAATAEAVDPAATWDAQIGQAVAAWARAAVDDPLLVRSWIRELSSLPAGRELQRELLESFVDLTSALAAHPGIAASGIRPPSRAATVVLLGGLRELLATSVEDGALEDPAAVDELVRTATAASIALVAAEL